MPTGVDAVRRLEQAPPAGVRPLSYPRDMSVTAQPRRTRQRAAVAEVLSEVREFHTAQQVHDLLADRHERVALATVYRTLQSMAEAGELDVIRTPEGQTAYRCCSRGHSHHHHMICRRCGHTVEVEFGNFEGLVAALARLHGFTDVAHEIELYGLCAECSKLDPL